MANYTVTDLELTSIANAIRTKGGTSTSLAFPSEFVSAINDISTGVNEDGYIQKTIQQVSNSTASYVARQAFYQCLSLESVRMENVTTISSVAFAGCVQLSNVYFPKCEYIDYNAFESTNITEVTSNNFPTLEIVNKSAFNECPLLSRVILNNVVSITGSMYSNYRNFFSSSPVEYIEMNALSEVPSYAFRSIDSLRSASFASATSIGSSAFCYASNLESITTGTLTGIGSYAFYYAGLKEFSVSDYIDVGGAAFAGNASLSRAYIPFSNSVPTSLFMHCSSLSSVYIGEATILESWCFYNTAISDFSGFPVFTSISFYAFGSTPLSKIPPNTCTTIGGFPNCDNLTTISDSDFPSGTAIASSAFMSCTGITDVSLSSVAWVREKAFMGCQSLVNVSLPAVHTAGNSVFQSCVALSQISLPELQVITMCFHYGCTNLQTAYFPKVSMMTTSAFANCFNLVSLYLGSSKVVTLNSALSNIFKSTPIYGYSASAGVLGTVYVPESLVTTYQNNASWRAISSRIVGYSF